MSEYLRGLEAAMDAIGEDMTDYQAKATIKQLIYEEQRRVGVVSQRDELAELRSAARKAVDDLTSALRQR
jgi:hypothetical protein